MDWRGCRRRVVAGGLLALAAVGGARAGEREDGLLWRRADRPSGIGVAPVTAIAFDPLRGAVAVRSGRGVQLARRDESYRPVPLVQPVTDLHFDEAGRLWLATASGLWGLDLDDRLRDAKIAADQAGRFVHRVTSSGRLLAVSTRGGVYLGEWEGGEMGRWRRVADGLPAGPVTAAALARVGPEAWTLWVLLEARVWRVALARSPDGVRAVTSREVRFSQQPVGVSPVDIAVNAADADVVIVYPQALAIRVRTPEVAAQAWRLTRPVLPSGATARRLSLAGGRAWLATAGGLLEAGSVFGPWRRSRPPAGQAAVVDVVGSGEVLWAATESGLLVRRRRVAPSGRASALVSADPPIEAVQRAALLYSGLEADRMAALGQGLRRRGWIPRVSLDAGVDHDRGWGRDHDESFVSGATRYLIDRDESSRLDVGAGVLFTWEFDRLAYDPEVVDLSREARQVITLRDNVLDEINQIYFERQGLLARIAAEAEPEQAAAHRLRADELRAGLDSWTGGWFSRQRAAASSERARAEDPGAG